MYVCLCLWVWGAGGGNRSDRRVTRLRALVFETRSTEFYAGCCRSAAHARAGSPLIRWVQIRCWEAARNVLAQLNDAGLDPVMLPAVHLELRRLLEYVIDPVYGTLPAEAGGTTAGRRGGEGDDAEMVAPDDGVLRPARDLAAIPAAIAPLVRALGPHLSNDVHLFAKVRGCVHACSRPHWRCHRCAVFCGVPGHSSRVPDPALPLLLLAMPTVM